MLDKLSKLQDIKDEVAELKKKKTALLVKVRRAEFWIKENSEQYDKVVKKYNEVVYLIKGLIEIKHYNFLLHIIANVSIFLKKPIKYIFSRPKMKSNLVREYWGFKKIKKEWEDDFNFTEKMIDKDYTLIEQTEKWINKVETMIEKGDIQYD